MTDSTTGASNQVFYLVRQKDSAIYERVTKEELERGLAAGEIGERTVSGWVTVGGKLVFSNGAREYFRQ